ncbi:MAG: hypothetical protein DI629_13065 [Mesorhizobium amorphae]|nr:MAG: hypothetical protein DI629_13065 [Mesorhizobium amorphae]
MEIAERKVSDIIGRIYESGSDAAGWADVIEQLRLVFHGSRACLTRFIEGATETLQTTEDPDFLCDEALHAFRNDPLCFKASLVGSGRSYLLNELVDPTEFRRGELWNEWYLPRDMYSGLSANLPSSNAGNWFLDVQRGRGQGEFSRHEQKIMDVFLPHVARAGQIAAASYRRDVEAKLRAATHAMIIVSPDGRFVGANTKANDCLASVSSPLRLTSSYLRCRSTAQTAQLRNLLRRCSTLDDNEDDTIFLSGETHEAATGLLLRASPLHQRRDFGLRIRKDVAITIRELRKAPDDETLSGIGRAFGLTPAEIRLAGMLASGQTLAQATASLGISITTGRYHLRQIFTKTGTGQQSQLVALLRPM